MGRGQTVRLWREVRGYAEAVVIAFLFVTFLFTTVGVAGTSMEPNLNGGDQGDTLVQALLKGDRVFIPKYDTWLRRLGVLGHYERGAIVVLREPANAPNAVVFGKRKFFIKRIIGVPGDRVRIEAGQVYVNGVPVDQGFITSAGTVDVAPVDFPKVIVRDGEVTELIMGFRRAFNGTVVPDLPMAGGSPTAWPVADPNVQLYYGSVLSDIEIEEGVAEGVPVVLDFLVPPGSYFVMGDNRSDGGSEDSRYFGPVDSVAIAGRATAVIWPPVRSGQWNPRTLPVPQSFSVVSPGN